jgi:hypothetical protein
MDEPNQTPDPAGHRSSRTYILIMLGIVILSFVAFLVLRPSPGGPSQSTPSSTQQH